MKKSRKNREKLRKRQIIPSDYKLKIELELSKKGYIYGTARELSERLRIPLNVIYRIINGKKEFICDKIRSGRNTYYIIGKKKGSERL